MAILKTNKNNHTVFVRYFVLFIEVESMEHPADCPSYIYSTPAGRDTHMAEFTA